MKTLLAAALLAVTAAPARADQCQWIEDPAVVTRAIRELAGHPEVISFCEPCGDLAPGAPHRVATVTTERIDARASSVLLDGASVDLAQLYLKTAPGQYRNLAVLAGCPTVGVSPSLRASAATSSGILIRAERAPAPAAAPAPAPAAAPAAPAAPAPASIASVAAPAAPTFIVVSSPAPSLWLIALLGFVVPIAGLGSLALWLGARRRERHVPRASRLTPP